MNSRQIIAAFLLVLFAFAKANSQQTVEPILTREESVELMLQNNFDIVVARNQENIAENNKGILNSNYLPSLQGTAGATYENADSETDFNGATNQDGTERENIVINDAITRNYSAAIELNYTLFDGLGRYYNYQRLQEQYNLSQLQVRSTVENTTVQLMSVYLEVARLSENLDVFEQNLAISKERKKRAEYRFEFGQVNKLEVLNALVDINADSINVLNARQNLRNTKRDLNLLMNRELEEQFKIDTVVTFQNLLEIDSYIEEIESNNVALLQAQSNVDISDYDIKTTRALLLPSIGLSGSYGWNLNDSPASAFFPGTTRTGNSFQLGANLTWNIFDGGNSITRLRNAVIEKENQDILKKQVFLQVKRDVANARGNYENALAIYRMQEQNVITNRNNFERTQEQFELGQVTSIEFRQAQVNLLDAETTMNLAKYDAKLAEYQLLQLTGQLLNVSL